MNICTSGNQLLRNFRLCLNNSHLQSSSLWGLKNCKSPINPSTFKNVHQNLGSTSYLFNRCATRQGATARFYSLDKEQAQELKSTSGEQTSSNTDNPVLNKTQSPPPLSYRQQQKEAGRYLEPLAEDAEPYLQGERQREQFYDLLKNCNSPYDVLDLAGNYTLTWRRVSNCLTKIWETTKKMSDDQKRYERKLMFEHPVFEQLCQQAMKDAGKMRSVDLAYSLLALVKLGVSQRSRVVQTLLRVIQVSRNLFHPHTFDLHFSSCPKVLHLHIADVNADIFVTFKWCTMIVVTVCASELHALLHSLCQASNDVGQSEHLA